MDKNGWGFLLCFMLLSVGVVARSVCDNKSRNYTDSAFAENLKVILTYVALNITLDERFYTGTLGQDSNRVYTQAHCIEGSKIKSCYNCINTLSQDLRRDCPNQTAALGWDADVPCMVRYSNTPIYGILALEPVDVVYDTRDMTSNLTQFNKAWEKLTDQTLVSTTAGAAGTSTLMNYGTATEPLTRNETMYSFMQCIPDISLSDCKKCLRASVSYYQSCCHWKQGGAVARPTCLFRWDLHPFYDAFGNTSSPGSQNKGKANQSTTRKIILAVVPAVFAILILLSCFCILRARKEKKIGKLQIEEEGDELINADSLRFDIGTIRVATDDFSFKNELGRGGFGSVYKGTLLDGQEIAVKRLSKNSGQGDNEFKTEVLLVAKLQHRNLVRLLGFSLEGNERVLVYEFVPNGSLDHFLFDPNKRMQLDWERRSRIIQGIARGLLYLHEDSRLRIIHRDLKASNILLDKDMCPKIADFGLARLFGMNETQGSTNTIVGTYGYMAPEYAMHGHFSVKTDVFSYGVLVLEIISGQKNRCALIGEHVEDLLSCAWRSWREETEESFVDPTLVSGPIDKLKGYINIGLLCVQEKVASRPTMALVVHMLNSDFLTLPTPSRPALFRQDKSGLVTSSSSGARCELLPCSLNECTVTQLNPR